MIVTSILICLIGLSVHGQIDQALGEMKPSKLKALYGDAETYSVTSNEPLHKLNRYNTDIRCLNRYPVFHFCDVACRLMMVVSPR